MKNTIEFIKKYYLQLIILILLIIVLCSVRQCTQNKELYNQIQKNEHNSGKIDIVKNKDGSTTGIQGQVLVDKNSDAAKQIDKDPNLHTIKTQIKIVTVTRVDTFKVTIEKPVYIRDSNGAYLKVPSKFAVATQWYEMGGEIRDSGILRIDSLKQFSFPVINLGYKKKPFFKQLFTSAEPVITFTDKNPNVKILSMSNITIQDNPKSKFGADIQFGYGASGSGLQPYFGIGLGYRLFSF